MAPQFDFSLIPELQGVLPPLLASLLEEKKVQNVAQQGGTSRSTFGKDPKKLGKRGLRGRAQVRSLQALEDAQELSARKQVGTLPPGQQRRSFIASAERRLDRPLRVEPLSNRLTRGTDLGKHELLQLGEGSADVPGQGLKEQEAFLGRQIEVGSTPQRQALEFQEFGTPPEPGGLADRAGPTGSLQLAQGQGFDPIANEVKLAQLQAALTKDPKIRENLTNVAARLEDLRGAMAAIAGDKSGGGVLDFTALSDPATFRKAAPFIDLYNAAIAETQRALRDAGLPYAEGLRPIIAKNVRRSDISGVEKSLGTQVVRGDNPKRISPPDKLGLVDYTNPDAPVPAIDFEPSKILGRLIPPLSEADIGGPFAPPEIQAAIDNRTELPLSEREFLTNFADTIAGELADRLQGQELTQNDIANRVTNLPIPVDDPRYQAMSEEGKVAVANVVRQYFALIRDVHRVTLSDELGPGREEGGVQGFGAVEENALRKFEVLAGGKGTPKVTQPTQGLQTAPSTPPPIGGPEVPKLGPAPTPSQRGFPSPLGPPRGPGGGAQGLTPPPRGEAEAVPGQQRGLIKKSDRPSTRQSTNRNVQDIVGRATRVGDNPGDIENIERDLRKMSPNELAEVRDILNEARSKPFQRVDELTLKGIADVLDLIEDLENEPALTGQGTVRGLR